MNSSEQEIKVIVVVDDDIDACEMVEEMIRLIGYRSKSAYNGSDAIELIAKEKPGLILIDLEMPESQGQQLISKLQLDAQLSRIPIITLSGNETGSDSKENEPEFTSITSHLVQPFGFLQLQDNINRVLIGES